MSEQITVTPPHRPRPILNWLALLGAAIVIFVIDQSAKAWVTSNLAIGETWIPVPALQDFLTITRSANRGAAFSLLPQAGDIFLIIALCMIVAILVFYRRMPDGRWLDRIAMGLLLGGVSSNALDRLRLGLVVDFFHIQIRPFISNVSNFADHAIVLGIGILFITQWTTSKASVPPPSSQTELPSEDTPIKEPQ